MTGKNYELDEVIQSRVAFDGNSISNVVIVRVAEVVIAYYIYGLS